MFQNDIYVYPVITPDKASSQMFCRRIYLEGIHGNFLCETVPINTHKIHFYEKKKKVLNYQQNNQQSGPEVIKLFSCSTQLSMKFVLSNRKLLTIANTFLLNIAEHGAFFLLINMII